MNPEAQALEVSTNYDVFQRLLSSLLPERRGQYALMHSGRIVEFFDRLEDAYGQGRARYADSAFSIQEITDEPVDLGLASYV